MPAKPRNLTQTRKRVLAPQSPQQSTAPRLVAHYAPDRERCIRALERLLAAAAAASSAAEGSAA